MQMIAKPGPSASWRPLPLERPAARLAQAPSVPPTGMPVPVIDTALANFVVDVAAATSTGMIGAMSTGAAKWVFWGLSAAAGLKGLFDFERIRKA